MADTGIFGVFRHASGLLERKNKVAGFAHGDDFIGLAMEGPERGFGKFVRIILIPAATYRHGCGEQVWIII